MSNFVETPNKFCWNPHQFLLRPLTIFVETPNKFCWDPQQFLLRWSQTIFVETPNKYCWATQQILLRPPTIFLDLSLIHKKIVIVRQMELHIFPKSPRWSFLLTPISPVDQKMVFRLGSNRISFDTFSEVPPPRKAVGIVCTNTPRVIADSKCGAFFEWKKVELAKSKVFALLRSLECLF